jgi:CheY-like chemotaxis protein
MNMPGLGGAGTLPRLRALNPTVPVLLATGRADQSAMNLIQTNLGVALLSKPYELKDLEYELKCLG